MIKRTATQLMKDFEGFSENFIHNKKVLADTMPSKSIRNKVAGYLSRLMRQKQQPRMNLQITKEAYSERLTSFPK